MKTTAKPCDSCTTTASTIFCKTHSAFLCLACDATIHNTLTTQPHERVWLCEVCEQSPASLTCKADAAALCITCDIHIHSTNPFAQRHERVPIESFYGSATEFVNSRNNVSALSLLGECDEFVGTGDNWVLLETLKNEEFLMDDVDVDPFLGFDFGNGGEGVQQGNDGVVPVSSLPYVSTLAGDVDRGLGIPDSCFEIDFSQSKISNFKFGNPSVSHNSVCSSEVGVVPDGNSASEISFPFRRNVSESSSGNQSDREAKVLRYREKRKNRKFEKTIRYASRKAYAETRPRIKGRFVKRNETAAQVEPGYMSCSASYGVVPSY